MVYLHFLTQEERLRSAAREWKDRYRTVFSRAGDPMALLDGGGCFLETNERYREVSGYAPEELVGRHLDVWAPERRDRDALRWWIEQRDTGKTARLEITRNPKEGGALQVDLTLTGVTIGDQPCVLVVERDVTSRRRRQLEAEVAARVGRLLVDSLDVRAVLPAIAEQIRRLEAFRRMTVLWAVEGGEGYRVFASWDLEGVAGPRAGAALPADRWLAEAVRHERPARRVLPPSSERAAADEEENAAVPRAQLAYPLVHRGGVVGLVVLDGVAAEGAGQGAERGMDIVAPALAAAVENARLFRQLRGSEEKFRTLVENAREIIFRRGMDGEYRYVNPVVEQVLGYQPEAFYRDVELVGRLIHPADRERHRAVFRGMLEGTDYPAIEVRLRHRSGKRWVWFLLSVFPLRDPAGNLDALEGILRDITDRKEAEAATREYEQRLIALAELSARLSREPGGRGVAEAAVRGLIGVFGAQGGLIATREGGEGPLLVRAAEGTGAVALPGRPLAVPPAKNLDPGTDPLIRAFVTGSVVDVSDLSTVPRDAPWVGELVAHGYLALVTAPLAGEGGTSGALALYFSRPVPFGEQGRSVLRLAAAQVVSALDRAEHLERARRQADAAERSERDLSILTDILGRDLRAPVASLRGLAKMLDRTAAGGRDSKQAMLIERVADNTRSLETALDGLMALLRADAALTVEPRVDTAAVIRGVAKRHGPALEEREGTLEVADGWPEVVASGEALETILDELVSNAVRFAGGGERPRVRLGWHAPADPTLVEIHVEDNGEGLSEADRIRAFEPLRKLEGGEKHSGAGVGLPIARRLAEAMGGGLVLRRGEEGGCRASLRLPRAEPAWGNADDEAGPGA